MFIAKIFNKHISYTNEFIENIFPCCSLLLPFQLLPTCHLIQIDWEKTSGPINICCNVSFSPVSPTQAFSMEKQVLQEITFLLNLAQNTWLKVFAERNNNLIYGGNTATHYKWIGLDWILLRKLVLLEHLDWYGDESYESTNKLEVVWQWTMDNGLLCKL